MGKAQLLSISLGVVFAVLLPVARWSVWLGALLFLVVCIWRWLAPLLWTVSSQLATVSDAEGRIQRSIACLGAGLLVAGLQFCAHDATKVIRIEKRQLEGCIVSRVISRDGTSRFVFASQQRDWFGRTERFRVTWRTQEPPRAGSCWQLILRLKPSRGTRNVVGFDYERWLFAQRFSGLGSVKTESQVALSRRSHNASYLDAREEVYQRVKTLMAGRPSSPLVLALAVGIRQDLTQSDWDILKRSGTAHLMAISGLHIGLAAMVGFSIGRYLPLWLRPQSNLIRRGAFTALLVAASYAAVAGFAVSTIRALLMLSLWHIWRSTRRSVDVSTTLLLTVTCLLTFNPWMAADIGFWLSAGAVAAIALAVFGRPPATNLRDKISVAFRLQFAITLLMLPLSITVSGGISWVSVPLNLLLIPLFSVCVVPLVLLLLLTLGFVSQLAHYVATFLGLLLDVTWSGVTALASQPWAYTEAASVSLWLTVPVTAGAVLLLFPPRFPGRWIVLVMVLPLFFTRTERPEIGHFQIDVLDVGQALAVVIQTHSHSLVYDTGNSWPGGDSARQAVLPFLNRSKIKKIDTLIVSHADRDHAGGAVSIQQALPTRTVYFGEEVDRLTGGQLCSSDIQWTFDGVEFSFLHPPKSVRYEGNQQSCVLLVKGHNGTVLFTGDLGNALERRLLPALGGQSVDLVIGAHHGSLSSSDARFINGVRSAFVVFSNGYGNQWGMPRPEVVQRWQQAGTRVLTTAQSGQLRFSTTKRQPLRLDLLAREPSPGLWRWRPEQRE